ncbi:hypothetical protein LTSEALA_4173 [Salmonella enterica subsp. enterica serovar Alachua str. R6-377]|uniref:Uncharacterized protein n=1 Tax=Salmonella enterica subsp. enterica serovar Alachua str. R6-377 TaxID=913241 RepID=G5LSX5_SALET|nr:hypothetical protein LTSEALA_4173 [Salmonella enterica subsp. enterica serovar Alachua str. R6-377]
MINIPELVFDDEPLSTDVTGAGAGGFDELVQPAPEGLTNWYNLPAIVKPVIVPQCD